MNGFHMQHERPQGSCKDEYKVNVFCIADQEYQWKAIIVDHSSKFEDICLMVNPLLLGYDTKDGARL